MMVGKLLVAHPSILGDPSFSRSVILLAQHNNNSAIGFIINEPTDYKLNDLLPELNINIPVFFGGPVETDSLFYVHQFKNITNAKKIRNGVFWGGDLDEIISHLKNNIDQFLKIKFLLGYSGWSSEQLKKECGNKNWINIKNNYDVFQIENGLWEKIIMEIGGEISIYASAPKNPSLN